MGRSLVINLQSSDEKHKFRQIDHRTIEYIIFRNVKYVLKKGAKKNAEEEKEEAKGGEKWDRTKLAIGNFFSSTSYFRGISQEGDKVMTEFNGVKIQISKDIIEHEMYNSAVYTKEEKLSLTKVVKILKEAHSTVFTVCFNCKLDEKIV